jgi:hypothetical protein
VIGRVIVQGKPPQTPEEAELALIRALDRLPADRHVKFLITPGGFIWAPEPEGLSGETGWGSSERDFSLLVGAARSVVDRVVTDSVLRTARGRINVLDHTDLGMRAVKRALEAELPAESSVGSSTTY